MANEFQRGKDKTRNFKLSDFDGTKKSYQPPSYLKNAEFVKPNNPSLAPATAIAPAPAPVKIKKAANANETEGQSYYTVASKFDKVTSKFERPLPVPHKYRDREDDPTKYAVTKSTQQNTPIKSLIGMNIQGENLNLDIQPAKIFYSQPYNRAQEQVILATNTGRQPIIFKTFATVSQYYRIHNKMGIIMPGSAADIHVKLDALDIDLVAKEHHHIVIQSAVLKTTVENEEMFWKEVDIKRDNMQFFRVPVKFITDIGRSNPTQKEMDEEEVLPEGIIVNPQTDLVFRGPFNDYVTTALSVTNNTNYYCYAKLMVTNKECYRARPNYCKIQPRSMQIIAVMLDPVLDVGKFLEKKNKLQVQYTVSDDGNKDVEKFWPSCPSNAIECTKLRAIFVER